VGRFVTSATLPKATRKRPRFSVSPFSQFASFENKKRKEKKRKEKKRNETKRNETKNGRALHFCGHFPGRGLGARAFSVWRCR